MFSAVLFHINLENLLWCYLDMEHIYELASSGWEVCAQGWIIIVGGCSRPWGKKTSTCSTSILLIFSDDCLWPTTSEPVWDYSGTFRSEAVKTFLVSGCTFLVHIISLFSLQLVFKILPQHKYPRMSVETISPYTLLVCIVQMLVCCS